MATPAETEWQATKTAGAALTVQGPTGDQMLMQPADMVIGSLAFAGFREQLRDGQVPGITETTPGCILMALLAVDDDDSSPRELVFADLMADQIISPTAWSDYSVYTTTLSGEVAYVAGPPIPIASAQVFTTNGACTDPLGDSLDQLLQVQGGMAQTAQRLLLSVYKDGAYQTYLVIIEPVEPDGCTWVLSQCSGCRKCGYEVICTVVKYLCH